METVWVLEFDNSPDPEVFDDFHVAFAAYREHIEERTSGMNWDDENFEWNDSNNDELKKFSCHCYGEFVARLHEIVVQHGANSQRMHIWTVTVNSKDKEIKVFNPVEVSEPYVSAEYAMSDWFWKHLKWEHVKVTKFGGVVLEHWQAEDDKYEYLLESQPVNGTE